MSAGSESRGRSVMEAMEGAGETLSAAGEARREVMLRELSRAVGIRRARRVTVRGAVAVLACAAVVGAWEIARSGSGVRGGEIARSEPGPAPEIRVASETEDHAGTAIRVTIVENDPGVMARYEVGAGAASVARIDDAELMRLMEEIGKPTGVIRTRGKVILTADLGESTETPGAPTSAVPRGADVART